MKSQTVVSEHFKNVLALNLTGKVLVSSESAGQNFDSLDKHTNDIMKWSWKAFGVQLLATFAVALGLAYGISMIIDAKRAPGAPDSTLISMAAGGFLAPLFLSSIAGWKTWALKSPLIVSFIVAVIYASNPVVGILCVFFSTILYFAARKCVQLLAYHAPVENLDVDTDETTRSNS